MKQGNKVRTNYIQTFRLELYMERNLLLYKCLQKVQYLCRKVPPCMQVPLYGGAPMGKYPSTSLGIYLVRTDRVSVLTLTSSEALEVSYSAQSQFFLDTSPFLHTPCFRLRAPTLHFLAL